MGAAVLGHQPTIMLPEEQRIALGGGRDTTLATGFAAVRARLDAVDADTLLIIDTHWFTTFEHVLAGQDHHRGIYTSEEVPRVISDLEFDYPGAPELARLVHAVAKMSPRQRQLLGFPATGDPYWTPATVQAVAARYAGLDPSPYLETI